MLCVLPVGGPFAAGSSRSTTGGTFSKRSSGTSRPSRSPATLSLSSPGHVKCPDHHPWSSRHKRPAAGHQRKCRNHAFVTLPNRWLAPGEYRRSLTVVPLIADQRYYGETPAGLPTYPPDWLVAAGERCGAKGWALTQPSPIRRAYRGVGSRPRARAQARSGTVDLHIGTCPSPRTTMLPRVGYQ